MSKNYLRTLRQNGGVITHSHGELTVALVFIGVLSYETIQAF